MKVYISVGKLAKELQRLDEGATYMLNGRRVTRQDKRYYHGKPSNAIYSRTSRDAAKYLLENQEQIAS